MGITIIEQNRRLMLGQDFSGDICMVGAIQEKLRATLIECGSSESGAATQNFVTLVSPGFSGPMDQESPDLNQSESWAQICITVPEEDEPKVGHGPAVQSAESLPGEHVGFDLVEPVIPLPTNMFLGYLQSGSYSKIEVMVRIGD